MGLVVRTFKRFAIGFSLLLVTACGSGFNESAARAAIKTFVVNRVSRPDGRRVTDVSNITFTTKELRGENEWYCEGQIVFDSGKHNYKASGDVLTDGSYYCDYWTTV